MKVKLTGIVEVQVEVETEIVDLEDFYNWAGGYIPVYNVGSMYLKYLRDSPDEETEIWMTAPPPGDGDVLTAEFVGAEVLDEEVQG